MQPEIQRRAFLKRCDADTAREEGEEEGEEEGRVDLCLHGERVRRGHESR